MYYYGARYYDPRISIFISVDPLAEKYPNYTPYHYVHQNPINMIDPTGMEAEGVGDPKEPKKPEDANCKDCKIIGLDKGDRGSSVQNQVYSAKFSNVKKSDFEHLKELFTKDPGSINDNLLAEYSLVDFDGDGRVSVGDHVDIDIMGPDNGSVVVQDVAANDSGFMAKFATLEGHTDAGWIYFGAFYDEGKQELIYTINNTTRTNTNMSLVGFGAPILASRRAQQNQWQRILGNVSNILGISPTSASMNVKTYKYQDYIQGKAPTNERSTNILNSVIKYSN